MKKQCLWVQALVAKKLQPIQGGRASHRHSSSMSGASNSLCVNCLEGTGMAALEATPIQVAHALRGVSVPESISCSRTGFQSSAVGSRLLASICCRQSVGSSGSWHCHKAA